MRPNENAEICALEAHPKMAGAARLAPGRSKIRASPRRDAGISYAHSHSWGELRSLAGHVRRCEPLQGFRETRFVADIHAGLRPINLPHQPA